MGTLINWLAIAAFLFFCYFVLKKLFDFAVRRKESKTPLPDDLADVAEDIAAASRVAAALATAAAFFAAPAGLLAVAAALGLAPKPLIATVLPTLLAFAVGAAALSAAAKLYAKSRRNRK